jgi:Polysaccharide deacetylase
MKWRILTYHGIEPCNVQSFRDQLRFLIAHGYRFCTVTEALGKFRAGASGLWASIAFDDGDATVWSVARPVLDSLGARAMLYVATDYVERGKTYRDPVPSEVLTWQSLRELMRDGHEVGSHTHTHALLTRCHPRRFQQELLLSKKAIEDHLNAPARHFAFPWGRYDAAVLAGVRATGLYATFATVDRGAMTQATSVLKRELIDSSWSVRRLAWMLQWGASRLYSLRSGLRVHRDSADRRLGQSWEPLSEAPLPDEFPLHLQPDQVIDVLGDPSC